MAKFGKSITDDDLSVTPTAPSITVVDVNNSAQQSAASAVMAQQTVQMASVQATAQADASVGLAEVSLDKEIAERKASESLLQN